MDRACDLVVSDAARLRGLRALLRDPFERARDLAGSRLGASAIAVHVVEAPDECIPEWGIGGATYGPHSIVLCVDPDHPIRPEHVFSTLVHEMHHAMRWRGPGCGTSLGERLVTEGLAQVFEEECTGEVPMYAVGEVTPAHLDLALKSRLEDPAEAGRWFFGAADLPRWLGYRIGHQLVRTRLATLGGDAAELVGEPAATFLPSCG